MNCKLIISVLLAICAIVPQVHCETLPKGKKGGKIGISNKKLLEQALVYHKKDNASDPFECSDDVTTVSLSYNNESLPESRPYMITFGDADILIQVYDSSNTLIGMKSMDYPSGKDFNSVKKCITSTGLKKLSTPEGDPVCGSGTVELKVYEGLKEVFSAYDKDGIENVSGNFAGLVGKLYQMVTNLSEFVNSPDLSNDSDDVEDPFSDMSEHYWE